MSVADEETDSLQVYSGYVGTTTATRELFIRDDGGLGSKPVAELSSLKSGDATDFRVQTIQDSLDIGNCSLGRLQVSIDLGSTTATSFTVNLFSSSAEKAALTYTVATKTLTLDATQAGYGYPHSWSVTPAIPSNNILDLDILIDRTLLEVFCADGSVITASIYPRYVESTGVNLVANGGAVAATAITLTPYGSSWS